jgi:radical SAM superfamily enzyme YgiQ (UPF0313 family)
MREITALGSRFDGVSKIFLGDGDPLALSADRLLSILDHIRKTWPSVRRISAYASPRNFRNKGEKDLIRLGKAGLTQVYVGYESGDDEVLRAIQKGNTSEDIIAAADKLHTAGIKISAIVILGVAGPSLSMRHAENTAKVVNRTHPRFLSALTLMCPTAYNHRIGMEDFRELTTAEVLKECYRFIEGIAADGIIFRSNHVSNYLKLAGVLQKNKARLLVEIEAAQRSLEKKGDWVW